MSAIDFAKIQKQMRAEMAAAKRAAGAGAAAVEPAPEPEPEPQPQPQPRLGHTEASARAAEELRTLRIGPIELERHRCRATAGGPRDVFYIPQVVTASEEAALAAAAADHDWVQLRDRRLQCHGGTVLPQGTVAEPLPPHLLHLCKALQHAGVFDAEHPPNHCLINEYSPSEGIMPHRDGPLYHPTVAILSLQSPIVFDFWVSAAAAADPHSQPALSLLLEPRSLMVFRGDAYADYHHAIAMREHLQQTGLFICVASFCCCRLFIISTRSLRYAEF
jgi:alkylated DNA repair protein alkB homolog 6